MSVPKYISAYEMDGYNDVFVIFSPWQQIPVREAIPADCSSWRQTVDTGI